MTKTKKNLICFGLYIFIWVNSALIFWLYGNNLDHRGVEIGGWYFATVLASALVTFALRAFMELP